MVVPFLLDNRSPEAQHGAAQWMYANYAALAYAEFLRNGRGVLIGPFAKTENGLPLDSGRLREAVFETGENWTATVSYLPVAQADFLTVVADAGIGNIADVVLPALDAYDPELQVPILLMRKGQPYSFFPDFHSQAASPLHLYQKLNEYGTPDRGPGEQVCPPRSAIAGGQRRILHYAPAFVPLSAR